MGGVMIIAAVVISTILWVPPSNPLIMLFLGTLLLFGAIGFYDDYVKVAHKNRDGISGKTKLGLQVTLSCIAVYILTTIPTIGDYSQHLYVPFMKHPVVTNMPIWLCIIFGGLVVTAASNAVNLTDGLDGLATGCTIICCLTYVCFAYFCGHGKLAHYLNVPWIAGCGEVCVFGAAIAGACVGFLWHNCYPASVFMGDTGSLALGGSIGLIAVLVKQELTLIIVGGIFVWEAVSVIIQVSYFKYSGGKRVFLMTPIHHHYQKKGWTETQVVIRFWIIAMVLAALGLATLKLR